MYGSASCKTEAFSIRFCMPFRRGLVAHSPAWPWVATAALFVVAWGACGGQTSGGGGGGASSATGTTGTTTGAGGSGPGGMCPSTPPAEGTACTPPRDAGSSLFGASAHCSWGDDPRPQCRTTARCDGTWHVTAPDASCAT